MSRADYEDDVAAATGDNLTSDQAPIVYALLAIANRIDALVGVLEQA